MMHVVSLLVDFRNRGLMGKNIIFLVGKSVLIKNKHPATLSTNTHFPREERTLLMCPFLKNFTLLRVKMLPMIDIFRSLLNTCFPGPQVLGGKPPLEKEDVDAVVRDSGVMTYFHHHWKLEQVTSLSQVLNTQEHLILVPEPPRKDSHWLP